MKIGIDLGGSHIAIGVVDNKGIIIEKIEKRLTSVEKKNIKKSIEEYIIENVNNLSKKYKVTSIGIAIPGTLNDKKIVQSVNLGLYDYNIIDRLNEKIDLPIKIKNDAKCAAVAENKYGSLKEYKRSLFFTLGTGIGGAVIIDNQLLNTGEMSGCEFGHIIIEKNGIECKCGKKGCFEKYGSMKSFKDNLRRELGLDEKTRGQELFEMIKNNKKENDDYEKIEKVVEEYIQNLSIGISNLINIFEPEAISIGGSFVYFKEVLLERLKKNILEQDLLFNKRDDIVIETAVLGNDAGIIGATLI